ncbi:hypothetical protein FXB90_09290 [Aggregatibacter actinomycetemcomitans]|nr:hypothetical protein FXB90_09290 [Aggregatibacter actinomycetemcomitans]
MLDVIRAFRFDTQRDLCVELFDVWQLLKEFEYSSVPVDLEDFLKTYSPVYRYGKRYFRR